MERIRDQHTLTQSKTRLVEQVNTCLRSGDYARAVDLLRGTAAEFPNDAELSELEKLARDGVKRNIEAQRLITESQDLFAQQKSSEAIQLLREAYELDKNNALARAILANALVEHAHSVVETDWLEAETLTNQALKLNPAHPTAKTIRSLIVDQKKASAVEDWVARARRLHSSGDLFAALAWVAEGLAVHPDDRKLLEVHDAILRDQAARRRQARRGDVEELRRMELAIEATADAATKQALAECIQAMAAKYWTDGEILAVANRLLHRLGFVAQQGSAPSPQSKNATVIFHVPRPSAPQPLRPDSSQIPPSHVPASPGLPRPVVPSPIPHGNAATVVVEPSKILPSSVVLPGKVPPTPLEPALPSPQTATAPAAEPSELVAEVTSRSSSSEPKQPTRSNALTLSLVSVAAIILVAATFFFTRKYYAPPVAKTPSGAPIGDAPAVGAPVVSAPDGSPTVSAPTVSAPAQATPEPSLSQSLPAARVSSETAAGQVSRNSQSPGESGRNPSGHNPSGQNLGTLLVVAGQDDASVFLDGKLQPQLTQAGQLRLPDLEFKDYVVQVSKSGFQDPPPQKVRIAKGEQFKVNFNLQPQQPRLASLAILGGVPETKVLVDQTLVGTIPPDGTLAVSTVTPGDHTVELRKEGFKPRQFKKHFAVEATVSLAAADAALEAAPGELKITFAPTDATVAIAKGQVLKMVSSGVPLNLDAGTYTLTARTAERFTRSSTLEVVAGQSKTLDLSLAPSGMSKWENPGSWKQEKDSFIRKGGDFVLYGVAPASGTFVFSAMVTKGHLLQWVLNYSDPKNYVLFQMDDDNFYRAVIRNGVKTDEIRVPNKDDRKNFRTVQIRVSAKELVHQVKHGDHWTVLDRWTQPGANLSFGKFGFYIPGNDEVALSSFAHYADLNVR